MLADCLHSHLNERNRRTVARALQTANPELYGPTDIDELASTALVEDILWEDFH